MLCGNDGNLRSGMIHIPTIFGTEPKLKPEETRRFLENAFKVGEVKTVGTDIDKMKPPVSRFGGGNRTEKKQTIIEKIKALFEKYFGIGRSFKANKENE